MCCCLIMSDAEHSDAEELHSKLKPFASTSLLVMRQQQERPHYLQHDVTGT